MNIIKKINNFFLNLKIYNFIIVSILLSILHMLLSIVPYLIFKDKYVNNLNSPTSLILSSTFVTIYAISVGPLIETLIFQFAIIKICKKIFKNYKIGFILSTIAFSVTHNYSLEYIVTTIPIAMFLAYIFILYDKYEKNPIIRLTFMHSMFNLMPLILCKFIS